MRAVVQRASSGRVVVDGEVVASLDGPGLVVLVGVSVDDGPDDAAQVARKVADLRVLRGELSAVDVGAPVIVVSQFTLLADTRKGRRPTWAGAARGDVAEPLVAAVVEGLRERGLRVGTGVFGADMAVELVNDGPLTILLDTRSPG
ncbi:D-tyrosyl-tRNA(Tyr) deacylase [Quadrisphaera granulorum]|uniref:D-aminoacyl-tRNA deacylase n=1 Tax=Quadrisphaera granulorum TaxID=317664 RepID=A0A316A2H6_9ACTN|nr:D-aminoacyl-tRNA deacylase [Quadrisphaera granulorum]PWJ51752.1 D-tyrosyl-tRNA(Tyr) deacylase [Quadrisphaera granulorum]SZE97699.1 D-tyrosyl-tRNA(Tyr) deacylase [Quadrisphaera granulorum]